MLKITVDICKPFKLCFKFTRQKYFGAFSSFDLAAQKSDFKKI